MISLPTVAVPKICTFYFWKTYNMKEVLRRALTGAVFIIFLLSAIFLSSDAFDFLLMIFGLACIYEYKRMVGLRGYYIFLAYLTLWWVFIYLVKENDTIPINILMALTVIVDLALLYYLFSKNTTLFAPNFQLFENYPEFDRLKTVKNLF